jgi:hypothetical protein
MRPMAQIHEVAAMRFLEVNERFRRRAVDFGFARGRVPIKIFKKFLAFFVSFNYY